MREGTSTKRARHTPESGGRVQPGSGSHGNGELNHHVSGRKGGKLPSGLQTRSDPNQSEPSHPGTPLTCQQVNTWIYGSSLTRLPVNQRNQSRGAITDLGQSRSF
ncbi:hypothetical protein FQA47_022100 [Oryzias melastigma]|uniref:Uncharacterized protein n=1 Tax=Oryzias melastigma TaxID=30732 RepID=A0A834C2G6_ORYME|nr:hypothetical protein FQA47_022100 [Oryzias melastigma]